jgi:ribosomal protein S12 methylthiotransferase accessory factor
MGITRLGNITGLDRIGIPVAVAVRPNSRSVSVSQGKGLDLAQAMASALMEACEGFHAEEIADCRSASYRELAAEETVVDPTTLCPGWRPFDPQRRILWTLGFDVLRREPCWVPAESVHTDYTLTEPDGYFLAGSNGLASGNHPIEAVNAALYELVERDAVARWMARPFETGNRRFLDLASVDDADCRALLDKYRAAEIGVRVWNVTSDIGIAAFFCEIRDLVPDDPKALSRHHGAGCHAERTIALARALTEAAQTRLTFITGTRDDLPPATYQNLPDPELFDALLDALAASAVPIPFADVPSFSADELRGDLLWALDRLRDTGLARAIVVDLTQAQFAIPVIRLIVPGLEWDVHHPNYRRGGRADQMRVHG